MNPFLWLITIFGSALLLVLLTSFICFYRVFYSPKRKILKDGEYEIPEGEIYEAFREDIVSWTKKAIQRNL